MKVTKETSVNIEIKSGDVWKLIKILEAGEVNDNLQPVEQQFAEELQERLEEVC